VPSTGSVKDRPYELVSAFNGRAETSRRGGGKRFGVRHVVIVIDLGGDEPTSLIDVVADKPGHHLLIAFGVSNWSGTCTKAFVQLRAALTMVRLSD
jgi:hypothetical protein